MPPRLVLVTILLIVWGGCSRTVDAQSPQTVRKKSIEFKLDVTEKTRVKYRFVVDLNGELNSSGNLLTVVGRARYDFELRCGKQGRDGAIRAELHFSRFQASLETNDGKMTIDSQRKPVAIGEVDDLPRILALLDAPSRAELWPRGAMTGLTPPEKFCHDSAAHSGLVGAIQESFAGLPDNRVQLGRAWPWETSSQIIGLPVRYACQDRVTTIRTDAIRVSRKGTVEIDRERALAQVGQNVPLRNKINSIQVISSKLKGISTLSRLDGLPKVAVMRAEWQTKSPSSTGDDEIWRMVSTWKLERLTKKPGK